MKFPQKYEDAGIIILNDVNEKEINNPRVQAMFKRSRHNKLSIFIISQDYDDIPKRTIRANGNFYHIFKPNSFRDVQNVNQDQASTDMTLNEYKFLTSTCWNKNYQPLSIDMTKDRYQGRYRLGLNIIFVPDTTPLLIFYMSIYSNVTEQDLINLRKLAEQQKNQLGEKF